MWQFRQEIKDKWIKSAALASIWASIEIVFGSFLHNVHAPFTGTILTVTTVVLLTTFGVFWREKGIFWRAGLITALMKSISPSAVLFGPMTAIFTEAILFELGVTLLGKNLLGFSLGGVLALASALVHKAVVLLILYGFKLVIIAQNLYEFILKQLHLIDLTFVQALLIILLFYVFLGMVSVWVGYAIARQAKKRREEYSVPQISQQLRLEEDFWQQSSDTNRHSPWIVVVLLIAGGFMLWAVESLNLLWTTALITVFVISGYVFYPFAFRYFKKGAFWLQIAIVFVVTVLFYNGFNHNAKDFQVEDGLIVAIRLVYRVFVLILTFSALSVELRNPLVKAILFRLGFSKLYYALVLSFSALPTFFREISALRKSLHLSSVYGLIFITDELVRAFKSREVSHSVYIISGCRNCGKTTFAKEMVALLKEAGLSVGGFFTEKERKDGFLFYFVKDLNSQIRALLCSEKKLDNYVFKTAKLYFAQGGLKLGKDILLEQDAAIMIVDEVGALELKGLAWSDELEKLFFSNVLQIWVVRDKFVNAVIKKFFITEATVFEVDKDTAQDAAFFVLQNSIKKR